MQCVSRVWVLFFVPSAALGLVFESIRALSPWAPSFLFRGKHKTYGVFLTHSVTVFHDLTASYYNSLPLYFCSRHTPWSGRREISVSICIRTPKTWVYAWTSKKGFTQTVYIAQIDERMYCRNTYVPGTVYIMMWNARGAKKQAIVFFSSRSQYRKLGPRLFRGWIRIFERLLRLLSSAPLSLSSAMLLLPWPGTVAEKDELQVSASSTISLNPGGERSCKEELFKLTCIL